MLSLELIFSQDKNNKKRRGQNSRKTCSIHKEQLYCETNAFQLDKGPDDDHDEGQKPKRSGLTINAKGLLVVWIPVKINTKL